MSKKIICCILIILVIIIPQNVYAAASQTENNVIFLDGKWRLHFGTDTKFSGNNFDDSSWQNLPFKYTRVNNDVKKQNTVMWARKHFSISSSMKGIWLSIFIGNLQNGHEIYLNGKLIGQTPMAPNQYFNEWNEKHLYLLPQDYINYDNDNVIAIKTYSTYEYGIADGIFISSTSYAQAYYKSDITYECDPYYAFVVLAFITFSYFMVLQLRNKENYKYLFFSLIWLCAGVHSVNFIIYRLPVSYINYQKIIFIFVGLIAPLTLPFIKYYLEIQIHKWEKIVLTAIGFSLIFGDLICRNIAELFIYRRLSVYIGAILGVYYIIILFSKIIRKDIRALKLSVFILIAYIFQLNDAINALFGSAPRAGLQFNIPTIIILLSIISIELVRDYNSIYFRSTRDGLTGTYNRLYFRNILLKELNKINQGFSSLIIIDIDDFKYVNDTYGHVTGDLVLKTTARTLNQNIPAGSTLARYGGEEFIILINDCNPDMTYEIAENIRKAIENQFIPYNSNHILKITISVGTTTWNTKLGFFSAEELVDQADKALYYSKRNGKNQATCFYDLDKNNTIDEKSNDEG
ncbi:MAG: diguanylate cyclase [Bacillota bacterium]|nr:diguanylate cyclase [Bacillota bacterium]